jgi:hypothetical protein
VLCNSEIWVSLSMYFYLQLAGSNPRISCIYNNNSNNNNILRVFNSSDDAFRLSCSIAFDFSIHPFFHSIHPFFSFIHGCIYSIFPGSPGTASLFLTSSFQWIIFGSRVGSILSTWPSYIIVSGLWHPISYLARPFFLWYTHSFFCLV